MLHNDLEEWTRANSEIFGSLPSEIYTVEIQKNLSTPHMRKMREICKFFRDNTAFSGVINQLSNGWQVFVNGNRYYFLSGKGHVYELNALAYIEPKPIYLTNRKPIINIIRGSSTTFYLDIDGDYHVSGVSSCGNLGLGPDHQIIVDSPLPFALPNSAKIKKIVAGTTTNFVCDIDGNWYGFGSASEGQIPLSNEEIEKYKHVQNRAYRDTPTLITLPNNKKIVDVVAASSITYFKDSDGQWFGCGYNGGGMLGFKSDDSTVPQPVPLSLPNGHKIIKIVAGDRHAFFGDEHGDWYGCGENDHHELGLNHNHVHTQMDRIFQPELVHLGADKKILDVVASYQTSFFKVSDGNWYACGHNYCNQLGVNGEHYYRGVKIPLPVCLSNNKKIVKVVAGGSETVFLDTDGHWHSYGDGGHGNVELALNMKIDLANPRILNFDRFEDSVKELNNSDNSPRM